jgi:chromosome transmission fidelity protein 18
MEKSLSGTGPVRYAVRQVLDQELKKEKLLQSSALRNARGGPSSKSLDAEADDNKENESPVDKARLAGSKGSAVKRDFFGRPVVEERPQSAGGAAKEQAVKAQDKNEGRTWISFNEGFSNAVRKPITLKELMDGF